MNDSKKEMMEKAYEAFYNTIDAIYMIDNFEENFTLVKGTDFFRLLTGEEGELEVLYNALFFKNLVEDNEQDNRYKVFRDKKFFQCGNYQGTLEQKEGDEKKTYGFTVLNISDQYSEIVLRNVNDIITLDETEKEKMDTIQQEYLFSMTVYLNEDTCVNSHTTEISSGRQDFLKIKYSDWRHQIVNMFLEDDRNMFLQLSSPDYIIQTLSKTERFKIELQMANMQGDYIWVRLSFNRMKGFSKDNARFVYSVQDIDEEMRQLLNQENIIKAVEEQNEKLKISDKAKSTFISNMSHEIRTPINAVLGLNEMIIRETTDEKIRSYAYDIKNASKILLSVINDILDFSKIESGKMEIVPVEYNLPSLINDACNIISVRMKEKGLAFELDVDSELPGRLYGDEIRITQIILNILTNAVKYTEKGKVTLSVKGKRQENNELALTVSIRDTGIGIKKEDLATLFDEFTRLDVRRNRNIEGTGLGMSIVVHLLRQMGSELVVESEYGVGSVFSFTIVQKIIKDVPMGDIRLAKDNCLLHEESGKEPFSASKAKILVVDDNRVNLKVVKALLKTTKIQVDTASSGEVALEKLQENEYQLVLMDHFMPNMDGVETLQRMRELGEKYSNIPVIALTANVLSGTREKYQNMGFDDFLEKPINVDRMEEMMMSYIPKEFHD